MIKRDPVGYIRSSFKDNFFCPTFLKKLFLKNWYEIYDFMTTSFVLHPEKRSLAGNEPVSLKPQCFGDSAVLLSHVFIELETNW